MSYLKHLLRLRILAVAICPALVGFTSLPSPSPVRSNLTEISLKFPPTGDRGAPQTTVGGGTRGDDATCVSVQEGEMSLVALMPNRENIGKTATATPTLYWYLPQTTATQGEFVLLDKDENEVYQTIFALPRQPGLVRLRIPTKATIKPGNRYSWYFMIICNSQYRNRDKYVEGTIEYVQLDSNIRSQLERQTPLEQAQLYAANQIWFETLNTAAQLRSTYPLEWNELLKSVGLEAISQAPFVDCCTANN